MTKQELLSHVVLSHRLLLKKDYRGLEIANKALIKELSSDSESLLKELYEEQD